MTLHVGTTVVVGQFLLIFLIHSKEATHVQNRPPIYYLKAHMPYLQYMVPEQGHAPDTAA